MTATVLVVDDDAAFRDIIGTALEGRGYRVVQASTARRATAMLDRTPPDLVVVDGLLPDETGVHWIETLRGQGRSLDVVFVSAFWRDLGSFRHLTADLGVRLVAQKPISVERFVDQIGRLLPAPNAPAPAAPPESSAVQGALTRLAQRFARSLPVRAHQISTLCARLADPSASPNLIAQATTLAHRLAGTAGTYGLEEVGLAALALEGALRALAIAGPVEDVQHAVSALEAAVRLATPPARELPKNPLFPRILLVEAPALEDAAAVACHERLLALESSTYATALPRLLRSPPAVAALHLERATRARALALGVVLGQRRNGRPVQVAYLVSPDDDGLLRDAARLPGVTVIPDSTEPAELARLLESLALRATAPAGRVLVVADEPSSAAQLREVLEQAGLDAVTTTDRGHTLERLELESSDLLLLDLAGHDDVPELVQRVRAHPAWQGAPIVVLARTIDPELAARAFSAGADDVIAGSLTPGRVLARISQRIDHARSVRSRAGLDPLTQLPSRGRFLDALGATLAEARRHLHPTVVALLDVDGLGEWNARHGRNSGDRLLLSLARLLESRLRAEDLRARLDQGTFALAFAQCDAGAIRAVIQGVLADFSSSAASPHGDTATFSAGIAAGPEDGDDAETLVCTAFERMVEAKVAGRDRVVSGGEP